MKKKSLLIAGVLVVAAWWAACLSAEPAPPCLVGRSEPATAAWAVKYTKLTGPASGPCVRGGELIGVQKYQSVPYNDPMPKLAIKAASMAVSTLDPNHPLTAIGTLPSDRPVDNMCSVAAFDPAEQDLANGRIVRFTWTNVNFFVTPNDPGTVMKGNVQITDNLPGFPPCTATYDVLGIWPEVTCGSDDECLPFPDYNANPPRTSGSGINPDYATVCSGNVIVNGPPRPDGGYPTEKACVAAKPFPSLVTQ